MTTEALAEALRAADDALPKMGERETVYCSLRGDHLREILAAYRAVPESLGDACRPGLSAAGEPSASIPIAADGVPSLPSPAAFVDSLESGEKGWLNAMAWEEDEMRTPLFTAAQMLAFHEQGRQQGRAQAAQWVPVSERLPEVGQPVLIATRAWGDPDKERIYGIAVLNEAGDWDNPQDPEHSGTWWPATHWMQLGPPAELGATKGDA